MATMEMDYNLKSLAKLFKRDRAPLKLVRIVNFSKEHNKFSSILLVVRQG